MILSINYLINHEAGQYVLYLELDGYLCKLYSSYQYRPCAEVMALAKKQQMVRGEREYEV